MVTVRYIIVDFFVDNSEIYSREDFHARPPFYAEYYAGRSPNSQAFFHFLRSSKNMNRNRYFGQKLS